MQASAAQVRPEQCSEGQSQSRLWIRNAQRRAEDGGGAGEFLKIKNLQTAKSMRGTACMRTSTRRTLASLAKFGNTELGPPSSHSASSLVATHLALPKFSAA